MHASSCITDFFFIVFFPPSFPRSGVIPGSDRVLCARDVAPAPGPWGSWAPSPFSASLRRRAGGAGAARHGFLRPLARTHPTARPRGGFRHFISLTPIWKKQVLIQRNHPLFCLALLCQFRVNAATVLNTVSYAGKSVIASSKHGQALA